MRVFNMTLVALVALATVAATVSAAANNERLVLVCDVGSSGTRMHAFTYTVPSMGQDGVAPLAVIPNARPEWVSRVTPGAASFASNPAGLTAYMQPLFSFARQLATNYSFVPSEVPIFVGATAGFRLLSDAARESLIEVMRQAVGAAGFRFTPTNVRIISGTEEGLLGFLAVNVLTGQLTADTPTPITANRTYGSLDMGGGSLQIAFQTSKTIMMNEFTFPYRQSTVPLYSYSFLGYGQDAFHSRLMDRIVRPVAEAGIYTNVSTGCFNSGYSVKHVYNGVSYNVSGTGAVADCIPLLDAMTGPSTTDCQYGDQQCSIGCAYQPTIPANMVFYASSSFYFTISALISPIPMREISLDEIWTATQTACSTPFASLPANGNTNKQRLCYQGAWFISLLHRSMGFPLASTHLRVASTIQGKDVAWPLGMATYEINKALVPSCPSNVPGFPTPTPVGNGNVVINFANMFAGMKFECQDKQ